MAIVATCPSCGKAGRVPDAAAGKSIRCPACGVKFRQGAGVLAGASALAARNGNGNGAGSSAIGTADLDLIAADALAADAVAALDDLADADVPAAAKAPLPPPVPADSPPPWLSQLVAGSRGGGRPAPLPMPPEPWYYGFLQNYAKVCGFLGIRVPPRLLRKYAVRVSGRFGVL
jgi:hypothetical protein